MAFEAVVDQPLHRQAPPAQLQVYGQGVREILDVKKEDVDSLCERRIGSKLRHSKAWPRTGVLNSAP